MRKYLYINVLICLLAFQFPVVAQAQEAILTGTVKNRDGEVLAGASVHLGIPNLATLAGGNGTFTISKIPAGNYIVTISFLGFKPFTRNITLTQKQKISLPVVLEEQESALHQVEVSGKTESRKLKESAYTVSSLNAREQILNTSSTADLLNQVSGVRVRQTGGLGSRADIAINGISGKQVRFFLDGIPLEFYGSGFSLNTLPLHLVDRIEVYKGLVPAHLGADALGGAMQIITRTNQASYAGATYSAGSFNTHKTALDLYFAPDTVGFVAGVSAFYNHSDNNYQINAEVINANGNPEKVRVPRYHDQFTNFLMQAKAGWRYISWADELLLQAIFSGVDREVQHGFTMTQAFGAVQALEQTQGAQLKYRKGLFHQKLQVNAFSGYNQTAETFIDSTLYGYNWQGRKVIRRSFGGETSAARNYQETTTAQFLNRLNLGYKINARQRVNLNILQTNLNRAGEDLLAAQFYEQDILKLPTYVHKTSGGLAYEHDLFQNRLTSISAFKYFKYRSSGFNFEKNAEPIKIFKSELGYSQAFKYLFTNQLFSKISYERAARLPDEFELLGSLEDGVLPNPQLVPETSHNGNLGIYYNRSGLGLEVNTFYRLVSNNIFLPPSTRTFSRYQNLFRTQFAGIEAEASRHLGQHWQIKLNGTYQDIRNKNPASESGADGNRYYNARLPNIPYLFGNLEIQYQKPDFLKSGCRLQAWWRTQYVNWFYLNWSVDGRRDTKAIIPTQLLQHTGVGYSLGQNKAQVSLEVLNLTNANAYDNYSVQRPGRMLNAKLSCLIQKN